MNSLRFAFVLVAVAAVTRPARLAAEEFDGAALYEKCVQSCVFLVSPQKEGRAEGTGTLIDAEKRLVITCAHLLDRSETVYAQFPVRLKDGSLETDRKKYLARIESGQAIKVRILHVDKTRDLALVQLDKLPPDTPALPVARKSARVGEDILKIGNPPKAEYTFPTIRGTIRGVGIVDVPVGRGEGAERAKVRVVTDVNVIGPSIGSGGPLVDRRGHLVAVATDGPAGQNVNRSVDVTEVRAFLKEKKVTIKELGDEPGDPVKPVPGKDPLRKPTLEKLAEAFDAAALYDKCVRSCVFLVTPVNKDQREGSGVLIDVDRRLVLTGFHVVDGSDTVFVQFPLPDKDGVLVTAKKTYLDRVQAGQAIRGTVLHRDKDRDLAVVQLETVPADTRALPLAPMTVGIGEPVLAIGNPKTGDSTFTSKEGVVRGVGIMDFRLTPAAMSRYKVLKVTHTAALSADFGGGVLVDRRGRLVAVGESRPSPDQSVHVAVDVTEVWDLLVEKKLVGGALEDPRPGLPPADKERLARQILWRAKLFADYAADADSRALYVSMLQRAADKYPNTPAGKEARRLLDDMK